MPRSQTTLVCTVGGSHAPIVRAIQDSRPDFVWFVCTDGSRGSISQIRGLGNCIKAHPRDEKPTLPNIPTQAGLGDNQYDTLTVPPDDPDEIRRSGCVHQNFQQKPRRSANGLHCGKKLLRREYCWVTQSVLPKENHR